MLCRLNWNRISSAFHPSSLSSRVEAARRRRLETRASVPHSPENRYLADVREINQDLISGAEATSCFNYDVLDPAFQLGMLRSLLEGLSPTNKLVVLPFGPKIFFAVTLIAAMDMRDVAVWHVSGEEKRPPHARRASGYAAFYASSSVGDSSYSAQPAANLVWLSPAFSVRRRHKVA